MVSQLVSNDIFQLRGLQRKDLHSHHVLRKILRIVVRHKFSASEIGDHVDVEIRRRKNAIRMRIFRTNEMLTEMTGNGLHFHSALIGAVRKCRLEKKRMRGIDVRLRVFVYDIRFSACGVRFRKQVCIERKLHVIKNISAPSADLIPENTQHVFENGRNIRVVRDGIVIFEDKISSLKRFKDDAREVASGYECGIGLEKFNDIKVGDILEAFIMQEVER